MLGYCKSKFVCYSLQWLNLNNIKNQKTKFDWISICLGKFPNNIFEKLIDGEPFVNVTPLSSRSKDKKMLVILPIETQNKEEGEKTSDHLTEEKDQEIMMDPDKMTEKDKRTQMDMVKKTEIDKMEKDSNMENGRMGETGSMLDNNHMMNKDSKTDSVDTMDKSKMAVKDNIMENSNMSDNKKMRKRKNKALKKDNVMSNEETIKMVTKEENMNDNNNIVNNNDKNNNRYQFHQLFTSSFLVRKFYVQFS